MVYLSKVWSKRDPEYWPVMIGDKIWCPRHRRLEDPRQVHRDK
jgi:hypothetical protein